MSVVVGGDPLAVVDGECVQDLFPAVDAADEIGPVGSLLGGDKVEHFECGLFVGEVPAMSYGAAEA